MPDGLVAAGGALLLGAGGILLGTSLAPRPDYVADILPGWLIMGAGAGFAIPTLVIAGTAGLERHQTSTGSAIIQMARWIGSTLGVAVLVIVLGSSMVSADARDRFTHAYWWASLAALLAAGAAPLITARRHQPSSQAEPAPVKG